MTKMNSPDGKLGNPKSKRLYSNAIRCQQARILKHFEECPRLSTLQARHEYGILDPGGRIMELRKIGYKIDTHWTEETDANGEPHRVGLYVYQGKVGGYHGKQ